MEKSHAIKGFLDFVYEVYSTMRAHEITLVYEGEITHQITKAFTSMAELDMAKEEESSSVQKKVYHVMVECLQNISKHADSAGAASETAGEEGRYCGRGIFMVTRGSEHYNVISGNVVDKAHEAKLREKLDLVNSMSREELNELYKQQMREGSISEKGGAGLGFIDIVRKTDHKLEYHFLPLGETSSFFILTSTISRN